MGCILTAVIFTTTDLVSGILLRPSHDLVIITVKLIIEQEHDSCRLVNSVTNNNRLRSVIQ
jgi:hypothetical protein